jgi:hypothetical protein
MSPFRKKKYYINRSRLASGLEEKEISNGFSQRKRHLVQIVVQIDAAGHQERTKNWIGSVGHRIHLIDPCSIRQLSKGYVASTTQQRKRKDKINSD